MKRSFDARHLIRSLFGNSATNKSLPTYKRRPNEYWRQRWIPKSIDDAINYLRKERRISKKKMTEELLLRGLGDYIGEGISVANEQAIAARQRGEKVPYNRFTTMLKRWGKDKGADISKFI
jgi:hypothetical protein